MSQRCPLCERRRSRRACPALGHQICAVCCGTKRLVQINCPPSCSYLASSLAHPPAVVQRQQERDLRFAFPMLQGLTERQHELLLLIQGFLCSDRPAAPAMVDDDVTQAARVLAETYETASRGIIYEHAAELLSAARLSADIKALIEARQGQGFRVRDADVAIVLRRIEQASREAKSVLPGTDTAYLGMLKRILRDPAGQREERSPSALVDADSSGLIVPGR